MKARSYTLGQVINHAVEARLADVHVSIPGRVLRYDETLQQVDVQPLVKAIYYGEDGEQVVESLPVVTNVPVMFPGAGGYRITFPVRAGDDGDTVLLVFSEASLDKWLSQGGEVDPLDERRHHLSDGVALLGLRDFAHSLTSAAADRMTLGDDAGLQIHIDGSKVKIGTYVEADLEPVALGFKVETALQNIASWLADHTHPISGSVAGTSALAPPTIPDVKSTSVEVKK